MRSRNRRQGKLVPRFVLGNPAWAKKKGNKKGNPVLTRDVAPQKIKGGGTPTRT